MKILPVIILLCVFAVLSCGSGLPAESESQSTVFIPLDDSGLSTYRNAQFNIEWRLVANDEVDWNTALHVPTVSVTTDENDRIIEAAGLWRGRPSDNVVVAGLAPVLRISYRDSVETVTFHWADGESCEANGFSGYRITRFDSGNRIVLEFLDESGEPVVMPSGIAGIQIENEGQGWYVQTQNDENDIPIALSPGSSVFRTHRLVDSQLNELVTENTDNSGEPVPIYGQVYRIEKAFDSNGYLSEVIRLNSDGRVASESGNPGWETYQRSQEGFTVGYSYFDSSGAPSVDRYGTSFGVFEYDQYGRMISMTSYDVNGDPVAIGGVCTQTTEYDYEYQTNTLFTLGADGELVDVIGIAEKVFEVDSIGNTIRVSYFDRNGEPARDNLGVHQYTFVYANHGVMLERQVWSPSGEPDTTDTGVHIERYVYDENGDYMSTVCLNLEGETVLD